MNMAFDVDYRDAPAVGGLILAMLWKKVVVDLSRNIDQI
jgi:hypothetical protein